MPQEPNETALRIKQRLVENKTCSKCKHGKRAHNGGLLGKCSVEGCTCWGYSSALDYDGEVDHEDTDDIICPYCGESHDPYDGYNEGLNSEDDTTEITCTACGGEFIARVAAIRWSYTTEPAPTPEEREAEKERERQRREDQYRRSDEYRARKLREGDDTFGLACACCGKGADEKRNGRWIDPERLEQFYNQHGHKGSAMDPLVIMWRCDHCAAWNTGRVERVQEWAKGKSYRIANYRLLCCSEASPDGPR